MFAGLGVILGVIPIFGVIMMYVGQGFQQKAALADKRIKMMNEIFNGFRVVRFYAWEPRCVRADERKSVSLN